MKLKTLVTLSSLFVFVILVVCVSVYAYNAYCTASLSDCSATASANNYGLIDGGYDVFASVGDDKDNDSGAFADGDPISDSVSASEDGCQENDGFAVATIHGTDFEDRFHVKRDSANF